MDVKQALDNRIADYNLLDHPFYRAWSAGELPIDALRRYAREYGAFIATIPLGWETIGDAEIAADEIDHIDLWSEFAAGLETRVADAEIPQVQALVDTARELFSEPTTALGALYAFEAQQPETAHSKLTGLKAFYELPASVEPYFETHSHDDHESEKLLESIGALPAESHPEIVAACEQMSRSLWDALTGIHDADRG